MTIQEAQKRVDEWIKTYGVRYFSELTNMAVLTEEVGELARVMSRKYGDQSFKEGEEQDPAEEMADVLWVLICLANQTVVRPCSFSTTLILFPICTSLTFDIIKAWNLFLA